MNNPVNVGIEDVRIARLVEQLAAEPTPLIRDRVLTGDVYLDGRRFSGCTFRDCTIYVSLGRFDLDERCRFEGQSRIVARGPALGLIGLVTQLNTRPAGAAPGDSREH